MDAVTEGPFSWEAVPTGHDPRYWKLGWDLLKLQGTVLDRHVPDRARAHGRLYAPLADLELGGSTSTLSYLDAAEDLYPGCLDVVSVGDKHPGATLAAGTPLRLLVVLPDRYYEGLGVNVWQATGDGRFFSTALEGRWGFDALLADALIAPAKAPIQRDAGARVALLDELRTVTSDFRFRHGLAPEGTSSDPRIADILWDLRTLPDARRVELDAAWAALPVPGWENRRNLLSAEVQTACRMAWAIVVQHRGDGSAPTPPPLSSTFGPDLAHPHPYRGAGAAASCAVAVALAGADLEATRTATERVGGRLSPRWSRAWMTVIGHLPGEGA